MSPSNEYRFQVNLSGMIDILSNHLYSSPNVFIREILQNATDAITARCQHDPSHTGKVEIELTSGGETPVLMIEDNGIGLTEAEIHEFLAMIGHSSKTGTDQLPRETSSFIGRFGIGLLSCFMVSDEIVLLTQSVQGGPSMEWRGRPDGTYSIRQLGSQLSTGTRIYLKCKPDYEEYFDHEFVEELIFYYGALLPYQITLKSEASGIQVLNEGMPIWLSNPELSRTHKEEVLLLGEKLLGSTFSEFIPLTTASGKTGGIAFIVPHSVALNTKRAHRVYLKQMLVSERAENILPEWAFFVKSIIWTQELQPTASREQFYEDESLERVREELGACIRNELMRMAQTDPGRLENLMVLHSLSMRALAAEDQTFYSIIYRWLPFETTFGTKTLGELADKEQVLYYTPTVDQFRQITHVASAQSFLVINGGYIYGQELLEHFPEIRPEVQVEQLNPEDVSLVFTDLTLEERSQYYDFVHIADAVLQRFRCQAQLKRFKPNDLPVVFIPSSDSLSLRSLERAQESSTAPFASILGSLSSIYNEAAYSNLYFNLDNPLVRRLCTVRHAEALAVSVETLYVNALLIGHYPVNQQEMKIFNQGILQFINWGMTLFDHKLGGEYS